MFLTLQWWTPVHGQQLKFETAFHFGWIERTRSSTATFDDVATTTETQMTRQIVYTPKAAKPPATYSQAVRAAGLIFVSGTSPADAGTGAIVGSTIQEQTRQCLTNVEAILEAAGSSLSKAVSFTVVLADEDDFAGMNEEWVRWFPSDPPARQGAKLPARIPGLKVSIAAVAEA